ncbi:dihydrouridine synthase 4-like protein [Xylariaceae sp. FL1651]|nr:dihydrouridine synthase 4-like protein [Xylariaceae sp. FL1651]
MGSNAERQPQCARTHPLKIFDAAKSEGRYLYACAPMVRYSKLAFRQTVQHYGTDLCWTPMILAKEFNRNQFARDSDLTISTTGSELPTIVQFGANSPLELSRASSLAAPYVNGVDLNCGCPQSWACAETLGAALMERRELVRDMVATTRRRLEADGWATGREADMNNTVGKGKSVSVKIRVHTDLRKTVDFITTVLGDEQNRNIDWLTIHPRTRYTQSSVPINLEALALLTDMFGDKLPILVSGDVFTLSTLPYTSHLLEPMPTFTSAASTQSSPNSSSTAHHSQTNGMPTGGSVRPHLPKLAGLMSARALLANPALFAGHETCPWEAVDVFMNHVARAPLPLKLGIHHLTEMCSAGFGPDRSALLSKRERIRLTEFDNWIDVIDYVDEVKAARGIEPIARFANDTSIDRSN